MQNKNTRWIKRFENFSRAYELLNSALDQKEISDFDTLQQEGLTQRFEYTFELFWKTIKDFLESEQVKIEIISPKNIIKAAARSNMLEAANSDGEILLEMLESKKLLSHNYNLEQFEKILKKIKYVYLDEFRKIFDYLSSKKNNHE